ncbi:MAG: polymerase sigma factor, sigma-70 family, partial [Verrucomicrobiales bacterium]|nr:polymerase sigma factor, sigma-70 family [Verrucomicrobiales bacterium]
RWAMNVLEQVLQRLETEYAGSGKGHLFAELKIFLTGDKSELSYAEIARKLQMSEGTLKVTVYRLRQRYGQLLRMEIGNTVSTTAEIDGEIRHLFSALS